MSCKECKYFNGVNEHCNGYGDLVTQEDIENGVECSEFEKMSEKIMVDKEKLLKSLEWLDCEQNCSLCAYRLLHNCDDKSCTEGILTELQKD